MACVFCVLWVMSIVRFACLTASVGFNKKFLKLVNGLFSEKDERFGNALLLFVANLFVTHFTSNNN